MAATITGIVYNDLNHNGQYDTGEPGIQDVFVVLYNSTSGCVTTRTAANGTYSFTVSAAGTYTVYEPVASPTICPPANFPQPAGFTMSNGPRKLTLAVTAAQVNNNASIAGQNFGHDTVRNPLACDTRMVQFVGRPSDWYNINIVTGQSSLQGTVSPAHDVNAIGYNILDNYLYGYDQTTNNLVRASSSGQLMQLLRPAGLPANTYNTGAFDLNGFLYLFVNDTGRFYTVDLRPGSSTFMKLVNPAAGYTEQTANYGTALSAVTNISDWVYDPADGNLYGIQRNGVLTRISPTTGQVTALTTNAPNPSASFGALAIDSTGTIYAIANNDGTIYKYTHSGNNATGTAFSQTYFASFNDAAMCPSAAILVDYGDAPDISSGNGPGNYNTLLANNGPRHELINSLTLGTQVTAEGDAHQNAAATGDDLTNGIQDDGLDVPLNPLPLNADTYSLNVTAVNETGIPANLYGWIDFNQNGLFEADEAAPVANVPSQTGPQTIQMTFTKPTGGPLTPSNTFLRLRLTTDPLQETPGAQDSRSVGPASDGEVEDYILAIGAVADLAVVKTADRETIAPGDPITYTIKVTNNGPDPATDSTLADAMSASMQNQEYSLDGGATWQPWSGSLSLGTLNEGESVTVLLRGTYDGTGSGAVINTAHVTTSATDPDLTNNTSTVITPIDTSADLSVTKTAAPSPATAGELLTYTITIVNNGPDSALDVTLTDAVPPSILSPEFSIDGGATYNPWISPYSLGELPTGTIVVILIRGTVDPSTDGAIENTATVISTTPDPNPDNNSDTVVTPINAQADISIVKLGSPKPAQPGDYLTYTLVVSNAGPSTADDVTVTDDVPDSLTNVEYSTDNGITFQPWPGTYLIGELPPGETRTILVRGIVSASSEETITNTAVVDSTTPDPDPDNNTSTDITQVDINADLSVTKTGEPNPVAPGGVLTYTIDVTNHGPSDAQNVTLDDTIPPELSGAEYSLDQGATWSPWTGSVSLETVESGRVQTILLRGTVSSTATGVISNTVIVRSDTPDPYPDDNEATELTPINTSADLGVQKIGTPSPVTPGNYLTYSVTVTNYGPDPAANVQLSDPLPDELTGAEYSTDQGATWIPWTGTYDIASLAAGASEEILLRGRVASTATGTIENTVSVSSDTPDPNPDNNQYTEITPIYESADVSVTKTASPSPVYAGEQLTYTITVRNAGPNAAQNVELADIVPGGILDPEFSVQGGSVYAPWVSPYRIGTLAAGAAFLVTIRGTVDSSFTGGALVNTASVSSTTPDPDPDNNTDTETTTVRESADIAIVKTAASAYAVPGQTFGYTLAVTNIGPSDAQNVTVIDAVPAILLNPEYSIDGGATYRPWVSPYPLGTVAAGATENILIRGTLSPSATGEIHNTAVVSSPTPDPDPDNNTSTDITPIESSADLSVVKTAIPNPVPAGGHITYTLLISNAGPSEAVNTVLNDSLPAGLGNPEISIDRGTTWEPFSGVYAAGSLAAGASRIVLIRAVVPPTASGILTNTATVSSDTPDPNPDNNTSTIVTPVAASADVSVVKSASPNPVGRGETLTYTVAVFNAGPADAQNVVLRDNIPDALTDTEYSADGGATWQPWASPYQLGTLVSGSSREILIRGTVSQSAAGRIANTAVITSDTPDPNPDNNTSTIQTDILSSADLSAEKLAWPVPALPGELVTYSVTVSNSGPDAAKNVTLYDEVQLTGAQYSTDGGATWRTWSNPLLLGELAGGQSKTVLIRGRVPASACGSLINTAVAGSSTPDPNPENNTSTVETPLRIGADLSITKRACSSPVVRCCYATFLLTVSNAGPETAKQVRVTDHLPAELTQPVFSADRGRTWQPWNGSCFVGTIPAGGSVSILVAGIVSRCAGCCIKNTAKVSSQTPDPNPANNTASALAAVCGPGYEDQSQCACRCPRCGAVCPKGPAEETANESHN